MNQTILVLRLRSIRGNYHRQSCSCQEERGILPEIWLQASAKERGVSPLAMRVSVAGTKEGACSRPRH